MYFQDLQALPDPVLRYFKYCLKEGQRPIKFCALRQHGAFRSATAAGGLRVSCVPSGSMVASGRGSPNPYVSPSGGLRYQGEELRVVHSAYHAGLWNICSGSMGPSGQPHPLEGSGIRFSVLESPCRSGQWKHLLSQHGGFRSATAAGELRDQV